MDWNEIVEFGRVHRGKDVATLALKASELSGETLVLALQQVAGHRIALEKLPLWAATEGIVYGPQLAMEQCSSQATALYKAALVAGESLVDLTGGLGVDFSFMARGLARATYVERQPLLCDIARHNFNVLGLNAMVVNGDGVEHLKSMPQTDTIYIDPARRDKAGNRVFALADCTPDVASLAPLMLDKARTVIIKLSPMLDHHNAVAQLPCVEQVHILSVHGECKEMLLVLRRGYTGNVTVHCVNDDELMQFALGDEIALPTVWDNAGIPPFVHEPNASIMKAGAFNLLACRQCMSVMSKDSHLLVSESIAPHFPGRSFAVDQLSTMNKKELKAFMQGVTRANVMVRNFPLRANELARRLRVADGGDLYIIGTTTATGRHILLKAHRL